MSRDRQGARSNEAGDVELVLAINQVVDPGRT